MAELSQFYKSIDEGDYHQANNLLSELELDEKELLLYKTVLLFREQKFDEALNVYVIRCRFNPISDKEMNHINRVVKEIILQAKERLKK